MPVTFSHPAIVLPAKYLPERWVSMTGLIVGSVTPDFEYFVRLREESMYSHTWIGMFWFDLPLALLLTFVYHQIVRNAFICNSPAFLRKRLSRYMNFSWPSYFKNNFFIVIICLLIGIASHLFLDSFTHFGGDFVKLIPLLRETTNVCGIQIPNNRLLQAISTIVGGIIVFYAIMRMPEDTIYTKLDVPLEYWLIVLSIGVIMMNVRMLEFIYDFNLDAAALSFLSGCIAGSIIAPLFFPKRYMQTENKPSK